MEPGEFAQLERIARARAASVADLMREAVKVQYLSAISAGRILAAARRFLGLPDTKLPDWKDLKEEIEESRG